MKTVLLNGNEYNTQTVEVGKTPSVTDAATNGFLHIPLGPGGVSSVLVNNGMHLEGSPL
jgi:hypothetical protein